MHPWDTLIDKFLRGQITPSEKAELERWVAERAAHRAHFEARTRAFDADPRRHFRADVAYRKFVRTVSRPADRHRAVRRRWYRYAAMLAGLLLMGYGVLTMLTGPSPENKANVSSSATVSAPAVVVKLDDGTTQTLTTEEDTVVINQTGTVAARKQGDVLTFATDAADTSASDYEVYVPYGQTFRLRLPDGTTAWLNAGSTLRFSSDTTPATRSVDLTGEAFFAVTKDQHRPFVVRTGSVSVRVLGTEFNVSAYPTDDRVATTLVEGAVEVYETHRPNNQLQLTPRQQATYDKQNGRLTQAEVAPDQYTGWMQNRLVINHLRFPEILTKLARTYNVTIINHATHLNDEVYKGAFDNEDIRAVLEVMALNGDFRYTAEHDTITITP